MPANRHDVIILGGGLAGGLAALALRRERPELDILLVEQGERIGGNHIWSFFDSDLSDEGHILVDQLLPDGWASYSVRFPAYNRQISETYNSIESWFLDSAVREAMSETAIIRASATNVSPTSVTLDDGRTLSTLVVLDARGLTGLPPGLSCGWQKFVGQMLSVPSGHGLTAPIVMDATVDQQDGYRFIYCLPFTITEVFVEDTYYSDSPDLDRETLTARIAAYADSQGWKVERALNEEQGVLPVVTGGDFEAFWPKDDAVARAGVRACLFHPLTSYSLPDAVRFALWLAREAPLDAQLGASTRAYAERHWQRSRFDRLLARMLMRAALPGERYRVLERFYRLPSPLIARFYAGRSTWLDRGRILAGKPPVAVGRAIRAMMEKM